MCVIAFALSRRIDLSLHPAVVRARAPLLLFAASHLGCSVSTPPPCADLLVENAVILTLDPGAPRATALAAKDGRLLAVGGAEVAAQHACPGRTERIDLAGRTVLPGLIDAHGHLRGLGEGLRRVDLVGTASYDEVLARVEERLRSAGPGEWLQGRGWDQNDWPERSYPTRARLDALGEGNPILLTRIDGHAALANRAALAAARIDARTPDPPGGEIVRDAAGNPTGVLIDAAVDLAAAAAPRPSHGEREAALLAGAERCLEFGLTSIHDAGIDYDDWDVYRELVDAGRLPLRVYAMLGDTSWPASEWFRRPPEIGRRGLLTVRAVKVYADGAMGSRGAALLSDYADRPGHRGLLVQPLEKLEAIAAQAIPAGFQIAIHAIGDRGNREALDLLARAYRDAGAADPRPRIEHVQMLAAEDVPRFASLGVIPSMQPTHCTSDMPWVEERVGVERARLAYAWRSLLDAGAAHLPLGSDFPVESPNPFWGIYAAITRQDSAGSPAGGWNPEQRLTLDEALRGFTLDAAYAAFEEREKGSLAPGKLADFIVVDRNPYEVPPASLRETQVLQTWVGGVRRHARP
jgi:predicted amidohydrolase YtcJ